MRSSVETTENGLRGPRTGRKRTRSSISKNMCSSAMLALIVASMNVLVHPANGFHISPQQPRSFLLRAVQSPMSDTLQPVKPKSSTSRAKRDEAIKAMNRVKVESALDGVDAQMLEMLSDQFLFPSGKQVKPTTRPRGRPDYVPGAMKYETMIKYREGKERAGIENQQRQQVNRARVASESNNKTAGTAGREKAKSVKGSASRIESKELSDSSSAKSEAKKRKRVVKNLPERKDSAKRSVKRRTASKGRSRVNNMELQKYYSTELLTGEEEYSLGVKIQLMVECEQVHEGLALQHLRLPTPKEWARACG